MHFRHDVDIFCYMQLWINCAIDEYLPIHSNCVGWQIHVETHADVVFFAKSRIF